LVLLCVGSVLLVLPCVGSISLLQPAKARAARADKNDSLVNRNFVMPTAPSCSTTAGREFGCSGMVVSLVRTFSLP
jgi:hypothetical protein